MNTVEFRAWDIKRKEMVYIDDLYFFEEEGIHEIVDGIAKGHHAECKIMQYTGFKDKNGKKIFEGDLFYWRDTLRKVVYREDKAAFMAKRMQGKTNNDFYFYMWNLQDLLDRVEVIGNIYENENVTK
ncbi:YopX family protein [Bacillus cereus]|uniref:YopX family protein n=1 Tax=Bacillus cereus TaxID=1396 RepID=UPI0009B4E6A1|nr:YopX family protein [Bacillus cereus]UUE91807.1 YopX family protein [Bacillus cereus]